MDLLHRAERVKVFVPDNVLVWISADIIEESKPGHYEIEIDDRDYDRSKPRRSTISMHTLCRTVESLPLQNKNMSSTGVEDMCTLDYLHEPSILDNLRRRHMSYLPYTYTGDICIAVTTCFTCEISIQFSKCISYFRWCIAVSYTIFCVLQINPYKWLDIYTTELR